MLTDKIAMGAVVDGSVWIRKGLDGKALPTLVIPPRMFSGRDPKDELQERLSTLEAEGYRILLWEDRKARGRKTKQPVKEPIVEEPKKGGDKPPPDFPRLYVRVKSYEVHPVNGAGPEIAEHFGQTVSLTLVKPGDAATIDPGLGIANLFFALTEAMAGRLTLADDEGNSVDPLRWLKASGLLDDPELVQAARRFGLLDPMSLLGSQATEAWFA